MTSELRETLTRNRVDNMLVLSKGLGSFPIAQGSSVGTSLLVLRLKRRIVSGKYFGLGHFFQCLGSPRWRGNKTRFASFLTS